MERTALILGGGDGTRMRPLSSTKPKAMLPVCGVPLIGYIFDNLRACGYTEIIIAADRFSNQIVEYLDGEQEADFLLNSVPEGTCAPIARMAEITESDHFAVIFGNVLSDADLAAAEKFHLDNNADLTIVTAAVTNPSDHILAETDPDGKVTAVITDPARESCRSDLALTGAFIIRRETARLAADSADLLTDFIPRRIAEGDKVINFTSDSFFIFLNNPHDLFTASDAVRKKIVPKSEKIRAIPLSATVAEGAEISSDSVIGENVTVCRGAKINGGIIFDGAYIGERAEVDHGIIGTGARLLTGAVVQDGAVIGDNAVIGEQAVIHSGVKIWNGRHIDSYACASRDIRQGFLAPIRITEDGICGETGSVISPQTAAQVGSALASLGGKIGIAFRDNAASQALALAVASGVTAAGADAWLFGEATEPALSFCTAESGLAAGCRIDAGITAKISFCSSDGLPLTRSEEKIIEGGVNRSEYRIAPFARFGTITDASAVVRLYCNSLEKAAPQRLSNIRAVLNTSGKTVSEVCEKILARINRRDGKPVVFHIGSNGRGVSAYTEETGYVFEEKLVLICCRHRFSQGLDIALPYNFPSAADKLAEQFGRKVLRYSGCPSDKSDSAARTAALNTPFVTDGAALLFQILSILEERGISLAEAVSEIPEMALCTRFIPTSKHPVKLFKDFSGDKQASGDGITLTDLRGRILIRPVKTQKGLLMQVESFSSETASELCDFYQDMLISENNL